MLSTGDIIKIVIAFTMPDNVVAQLVTHYIVKTGSDIAEGDTLDAIDTALATAWANIEDRIVDGVLGDTMKLSVWDAINEQFDEVASKSVTGFDGVSVAEMLPHGVAGVIRFFTAIGRRQGRKFIMGLTEGSQQDGDLEALAITDLSNFALAWDNNVTIDSTQIAMGVFNEVTGSLQQFINTVAVNTVVGYQRRRKAGVGI